MSAGDRMRYPLTIELLVSYQNKILGDIIDTRELTTGTPYEFIVEVLVTLNTTWGSHCKQFLTPQAAELAGKLQHISKMALWLTH